MFRGKGLSMEKLKGNMENSQGYRSYAIRILRNNGIKVSGCPGAVGLAKKLIKHQDLRYRGKLDKSLARKLIKSFYEKSHPNFIAGKEVHKPKKAAYVNFYETREWRELRYKVLIKYKATCMCCGRCSKTHGIVLHVDHVKPRSKFPELSLDIDNLQILCADCNLGKSNKDTTDWRSS